MASKINYGNKAPFQTREDIPDENKVNAEDMNEIKTAVNNNADELDTAKGDIENLQSGQGTVNTDITSLKNRVNTLESDNKTNKSDISSLKTDNETNKSDIKELQEDNETNKTNITNLQNDKVDKIEGKDLSTNDFTTELKTKLEGLENYNDTEIKQDIAELEEKVSTLEEDNTTNKTNIEALQEDNTQNKKDISNLKESQAKQNEVLNDVIFNLFPTETQEGENINIKGTIPVKFKEFGIGGNSKQERRSGKNVFNLEELTSTKITDTDNTTGTFTMSNCWAAVVMDNSAIQKLLKPSTEYKCIATVELNSKPDDISLTINNQSSILALYNGTRTINVLGTETKDEKNNWEENTSKDIKINFTTPDDFTDYRLIAYNYYVDNAYGQGTFKIKNMMILEATEEDESFEPYGAMPSPEFPSEIQNVEGDVNVTVANKEKTEQQTVTFPLSQGQKLYLGDYLAEDGIHHVRKQIELDGTEDWQQYNNRLYLYIEDAINTISSTEIPNIKSNMFIATNFNNMSNNPDNAISYNLLGNEDQHRGISFYSNKYFTDVSALKSWLASQKEAETPVIVEYELAEEEIEAYTPEQQEAYNQICNLKAYEEETNIFSTNETSTIFKVTAIKDFNSIITQLNSVLLERS